MRRGDLLDRLVDDMRTKQAQGGAQGEVSEADIVTDAMLLLFVLLQLIIEEASLNILKTQNGWLRYHGEQYSRYSLLDILHPSRPKEAT